MRRIVKCPKCKSSSVLFRESSQQYLCENCDHEFEPPSHAEAPLRIFLSYGHDEHADLAAQVKRDLQDRGHEVWFDLDRLSPGEDWAMCIEEGLNWASQELETGCVVLLMTPHSVRRPNGYCLNEIARALVRGLKVIPVMVVWSEPPLSICRIQWLDMRDCVPVQNRKEPYKKQFARLLEALEQDRLDFEGMQPRLLNLLKPISFDADIVKHLTNFTGRQWVFDQLDEWLTDPGASRVFWITGKPGAGKTAIAAWLCSNRREIAAFHLCKHGHDRKANPRWCVMSIAYQLSCQLFDYQERLASLNLEESVSESNARTLFDTLIVQPLSANFPEPEGPIVILIDGLDEATKGRQNELAEFLASEFEMTPSWLRLIITSRPDPEVAHPLQGFKPFVLDASSSENEQDLREYLQRELRQLEGSTSVPQATVDLIIQRSEGVFLYVERVCHELQRGRLSLDRVDEFPQGLGGVYAQFFKRQFGNVEPKRYQKEICPALEVIVASREPIEIRFLGDLLGDEYPLDEMVSQLGSMFGDADGYLDPFHKTLTDWVTERSTAGKYFVNEGRGEQLLAEQGLAATGASIQKTEDYFIKHLPSHLAAVGKVDDIRKLLVNFEWIRKKLFVSNIVALREDYLLIRSKDDGKIDPLELVRHALQLSTHVLAARRNELAAQLLGRLMGIEHPEIQALVSDAAKSRDGPYLRPLTPSLTPPGTSLVSKLAERDGGIEAAVLTPDGNQVVYIREVDKQGTREVKVWYVGKAGASVAWCTLDASCIAVSHDGAKLAVAGDSGEVSIWRLNVRSGTPDRVFDAGLKPAALSFANNSTQLILVSTSGTIKFWNLNLDTPEPVNEIDLQAVFPNETFSRATAVAIAPEANLIFVGTGFMSVDDLHVWDLQNRRLVSSSSVNLASNFGVTPDGAKILRMKSFGTEIEVCDHTNEGYRVSHKLPGNGYTQESLAITPDGSLGVAASYKEICVWDLAPQKPTAATMGRSEQRQVLVVGEDQLGATIQDDGSIQLWDLASMKPSDKSEAIWVLRLVRYFWGKLKLKHPRKTAANSNPFRPISRSNVLGKRKGGAEIVLGRDGRLCAWSVVSRNIVSEVESPVPGFVVAASADFSRAITAGPENELVVWDLKTKDVLCRIDDIYSEHTGTQIFSPDGNRIVVSKKDNSLTIWDVQTGSCIKQWKAAHEWYIDTIVTWSTPKGDRIASGSRDKTVRVWDPEQSEPLMTLEGHTYTIGRLIVMPDQRLSSCGGETICVWNLTTQTCEVAFTADATVWNFDITSDGKYLVARDLSGTMHKLEYHKG